MYLPPPGTVPVSSLKSTQSGLIQPGVLKGKDITALSFTVTLSQDVWVPVPINIVLVCVGGRGCWVLRLPSLGYSLYCLGSHPNLVRGSCETLSLALPTLHCSLLLHGFLLVLKELDWAHGSSWSLDPGYMGHTHPWMQ